MARTAAPLCRRISGCPENVPREAGAARSPGREGGSRLPTLQPARGCCRVGRAEVTGSRGAVSPRRVLALGRARGAGGVWEVPWGRCSAPAPPGCPCPGRASPLGWVCSPSMAQLQPSGATRHMTPPRPVSPLAPCHLCPVPSCTGTWLAGPAPRALLFTGRQQPLGVTLWPGVGGRAPSRTGPSLSPSLPPARAPSSHGYLGWWGRGFSCCSCLAANPRHEGWGQRPPQQVPPQRDPSPWCEMLLGGRTKGLAPGQPPGSGTYVV